MKVPVLVLAFNRPEHVKKAIGPICQYQPERLYLACDGPRLDKEGENLLVADTQKSMLDAVSWPCKVKKLFREKNLGCAKSVFEAVSWFFEKEEYGIIIEDDVVVSQGFFRLCEELLEYYKNDDDIMMIGAQNRSERFITSNQFVFGRYTYIWGWATWRRAWKKMDMSMKRWPSCNKMALFTTYGLLAGFVKGYYYSLAYKGGMSNSWATRWAFTVFINKGMAIMPMVNLAKNIGIGQTEGANYKKGDRDPYKDLGVGELIFPLSFPSKKKIDKLQYIYAEMDFLRQRFWGIKKKIGNIVVKNK